MTDKIIVYCTCGSADEAGRIARALVESRAAACVSIVPGVRSLYRWKDAIEDSEEWLLVIKTLRDRFDRLRDQIRSLHSYEVPEIVATPIVDGLDAYLGWIGENVE